MSAWPTPEEEAFHGIAGEFVALTEPHTEADPMALLVQFLVGFGAAAGRGSWWPIEAQRHHPNEFCVLVGATGKGRKGSSWSHVENVLGLADPSFVEHRLVSGLASGEGVISQVRDPESDEDLDAPADKRLLAIEPESSQLMKVLAREGNTLSPVVRNAWDGRTLQTVSRHAPMRATDAHVAVVGHVTRDELLRHLNATELANGFFNRFLVVCVQRSKLLPFGGAPDESDLKRLAAEVRTAIRGADTGGEVKFSDPARELWVERYESLTRAGAGMHGAATARGEAHAARLALIYALLDCAPAIQEPHLVAALAVWSYCDRSARWVFGESLGDPTADEIWALARERDDGITRTDVRDLFSRNKRAREIDRALQTLVDAGRLKPGTRPGSVRGRPAEIWLPVAEAA